ncbi:hypothetical protein [Glaciecola petra]|uniref:Phosphate ABC transporter substrate-binding protein n=1 Tax=Glaciecola petra TaxID=3075602 RepID=A0ABU2ZRP8_9ALTE|nr:hypothetical protein [Aestuariibacter sp. P117]MDT0595307.1 hypothetical protein [Aestuariibacter sp. P117]
MLLTLSFSVKGEDLVLVVNKNNPTSILKKTQVIDLYMGKFVAFPDGSKAIPIDLADGSETKATFYKLLVGMPLARVNAYWSRVKFSGRARPPLETDSQDETIKFIQENEFAIAYIHESNVTDDLKVVYRFDE